jgi:hypothetical protein
MKLSKELELWHCDRPDEWKMDEFRRNAEKLEAERDALAAQVEALKDAANSAYCHWNSSSDVFGGMKRLIAAVEATPAQCLADVRAEAGRAGFIAGCELIIDLVSDGSNTGAYKFHADEYAKKIRQGGAK